MNPLTLGEGSPRRSFAARCLLALLCALPLLPHLMLGATPPAAATGPSTPPQRQIAHDLGRDGQFQFPPVTELREIRASDSSAVDNFAYSMAADGDTLVVGAPSDSDRGSMAGSVYVFGRNQGGANNWGQVKKLVASDPVSDDRFGLGVDVDDNTLVVTSIFDDAGAGSAYVFERNQGGANNWGQVKKLVASDPVSDDRFGLGVDVDDNTLVVTSIFDDAGAGSAYVFERNQGGANNWGQSRKIVAPGRQAGDYFGRNATISGDVIAVGAPNDDTTAADTGAVYLFGRNTGGANNWGAGGTLVAPDAQQSDAFGHALDMQSGTLLIGAPFEDDRGTNAGAVYSFLNLGAGFSFDQKLTPPQPLATAEFGDSVALAGDLALIGAPFSNVSGNAGTAFGLSRSGAPADWSITLQYAPSDGDSLDRFGNAVAISGDRMLVGSDGHDHIATNAGVVYEFAAGADLAIHKAVTPAIALPGQAITYTLRYTNTTAVPALAVRITDTLPLSLTATAYASSRPITLVQGTRYAWDAGTLPAGAGGLITITGRLVREIAGGTTIANQASISAAQPDPSLANNTASAMVQVRVPTVSFAVADYSVRENAGPAAITVTLSQANPYTSTVVRLTTSDGTATGADYRPVAAPVTIPAGATAATATISITDDLLVEGDETVLLALSGPVGASLGGIANATLVIEDNDLSSNLVFAPLVFKNAPAPGLPIQITPGIAVRPVTSRGERFFNQSFVVNYTGGRVMLARNADATGDTLVDDQIVIRVQHPDGTIATFIHGYYTPGPAPISTPLPPQDIASYFQPGVNTIQVEFADVHGFSVFSTPVWLAP